MPYTFTDYQNESKKTAIYPSLGHPVVYPTLGLMGEAGEIAEKVKKIFRDKDGEISDEDHDLLKKEIGDVLWYLSQVATELEIQLEDVATHNIEKLKSRADRGKLKGDGDTR